MEEAATWRTHRAQGQVNALSMFCVAAALSNFSCSAFPDRQNSPSPRALTRHLKQTKKIRWNINVGQATVLAQLLSEAERT